MYCPKCGKKIPDNSIFCMFCGEQLTAPDNVRDIEAPVYEQIYAGTPKPPQRVCEVCGRALPDTSVADVCVTCLYNRNFVAQPLVEQPERTAADSSAGDEHGGALPEPQAGARAFGTFHITLPPEGEDYPAESQNERVVPQDNEQYDGEQHDYEQHNDEQDESADDDTIDVAYHIRAFFSKKRTLKIAVAAVVCVFVITGVFLLFSTLFTEFTAGMFNSAPPSKAQSSSTADVEYDERISSTAQDMVRALAYSPDSVHFDTRTMAIEETEQGIFSVSQSFERLAPSGETKTSIYTAIMREDSAAESGYEPLMLKIDGKVLYDYR